MDPDFQLALSYDDVLLVPQYSTIKSRSTVDLTTKITDKIFLKLPVISINMNDVTGIEMAIALGKMGGLSFLPRFESPKVQAEMVKADKKEKLLAAAAIGCKDGYMERAELLVKAGVDVLTIDVAHGHMLASLEATSALKNRFKDKVAIISGVIATEDGADDLFKAGADSVRVGVGPGTICITRIVTGFGVPQLTAVINAVKAARKHGKTILADGGTKNSGDIAKALAAGASAVVISSQLAGTDEAPGELVMIGEQQFKRYNASTSYAEKEKHTRNLTDTNKNYLKHIEGVESLVPYKGPVEHIISGFEHNLKSAFSYAGAKNIEEFWARVKFIRVTPLGQRENGAHDVKQI